MLPFVIEPDIGWCPFIVDFERQLWPTHHAHGEVSTLALVVGKDGAFVARICNIDPESNSECHQFRKRLAQQQGISDWASWPEFKSGINSGGCGKKVEDFKFMKQLQDSRRKFLISVKCKTKKADLYLHSVSIYNARRYIFFCTELLLYRLSEEWKTRGQGYDEVHYVTGTEIMPFEC